VDSDAIHRIPYISHDLHILLIVLLLPRHPFKQIPYYSYITFLPCGQRAA
jgi:hypothetical protein